MNPKYTEKQARIVRIWSVAYQFYLEHKDMANTEDEWTECGLTASKLYSFYGKEPLIRELLLAVIKTIEDRMKAEEAA